MNFLTNMVERRTARIAVEYGTRSVVELKQHALSRVSSHSFEAALSSRTDVGIIAEVKKASPSVGRIAPDKNVAEQARRYQEGGATAVSVLTEPESFGGSFEDLALVRDAVELPVLCKDFVVDLTQVYVARALGADAILLMVNVLGDKLEEYLAAVHEVGMSALVEAVDETELAAAHDAGARIIGVNSRDLHTLKVDRSRALEVVRAAAGMGLVVVSASGVKNKADVEQAAGASANAVLVGEMLMRAQDPAATLNSLTGVPRGDNRTIRQTGEAIMKHTLIKICGVARRQDAEEAVKAGADAIGVILAPSKRRVTVEEAMEIFAVVPSIGAGYGGAPVFGGQTVERVGVFVNAELSFVNDVVKRCGLSAVQLSGSESPDYCAAVTVPVIKMIPVGKDFSWRLLERYRGAASTFLLDTHVPGQAGGTSQTFSWETVGVPPQWAQVLVAGGLTSRNVADCIRISRPAGVDVSSGVEKSPGEKDRDEMNSFCDAVRSVDCEEQLL